MEHRRGGASEIIPWLTMKAAGVRGATAQPAERDGRTDRRTDRQRQDDLEQLGQSVERRAVEARRVHNTHLLEFSGLLSGMLKSLLVGMGGTRASLGS